MAGKSQVQKQLDDLEKGFSAQVERLKTLTEDFKELKAEFSDARTNIALLFRDLDEVRRNVEELKRIGAEAESRRWTLLPPLVGAIASVLLSALVSYLMTRK